jgi:hypothetical protein
MPVLGELNVIGFTLDEIRENWKAIASWLF